MQPFVVVVGPRDPRERADLATRLLARLAPQPTDDASTHTSASVTFARCGAAPLVDPARGLVVLCEGRLDNRRALAAELGLSPDATFEDCAAAAWDEARAHPGADPPCARLEGDFVVVVWDARAARLEVARDAFGTRPAYHRRVGELLIVASHVEALVAPELGSIPDPDPAQLLDYLTGQDHHDDRTFFADVGRVPPGHFLRISNGTLTRSRHFTLPARTLPRAPTREVEEELCRLFSLSVEARARTDAPLLIQLSGGIDSTAVAAVAAELWREGRLDAPSVALWSKVFPGRGNDESRFIDATAARLPFPSHRWDGRGVAWANVHAHDVFGPGRPLGERGDAVLAEALGARVVLSGIGGDELLFERGVPRDLASSWRFLELARVIHGPGRYSTRGPVAQWREALGATLPPAFRAAVRRRRPAVEPPDWLGPALLAAWPPTLPEPSMVFASEAQRMTWMALTRPQTGWTAETEQRNAMRHGLELRFPWLDIKLARFVLSLPWESRIPRRGMKSLARQALPLPAEVADRVRPTAHQDGALGTLIEGISRLGTTLTEGPWRAAPYVERSALVRRLAKLEAGQSAWQDALLLWRVASLEHWLRAFDSVAHFAKASPS